MSPGIQQTFGQSSTAPPSKLDVNIPSKGNISKDKVIKKRASRACQCCRERKVRCNIVEYGPPCTNCRLDNVTCIEAENKRKRKHNFKFTKSQHQVSELHGSLIAHLGIPEFEVNVSSTVNPADILNFDFGNLSDAGTFQNEGGTDKTTQYDYLELSCQEPIRGLRDVQNPLRIDFDQPSPSLAFDLADHENLFSCNTTAAHTAVPEKSTPPATYILPYYLDEIPQHLTTDEIEILLRKSAFSIPENGLRNHLLQAYIEYIHPCMPLINIHELLQTIQASGKSGRISLMLFQAVMFAGTAFIDMGHLHAVGFANRREAQNTFYQRCRILYDIDYETNCIALIQSLILMTYSPCSPDDPKGARHWLDIAISLAYRIGLNKNNGKSSLDLKRQSLLKRLWWCCLMRDRLVALETKGLVIIKDGDFDIPMWTLEDFEVEILPRDNYIVAPDFTMIRDLKLQTELALICIEEAKLCLYIGHVICLQFSLLNKDDNIPTPRPDKGAENIYSTSSSLAPQPWCPEHVEKVLDCDFELSTWLKGLPWRFGLEALLLEQHHQNQRPLKTILVYQSFLHILQSAALHTLHEPQSLSVSGLSTLPNGRDLQDLSLLRVYTACKTITSIGLQLHTLNLITYLPTTTVAIIVPATGRHLSDLQISIFSSAHPDDDYSICSMHNGDIGDYEDCNIGGSEDDAVLKRSGRQRSNQCVQLLESLQYASPTTAASHAIRVLGVAAAATSSAKVYRSDIDLALALATRDVRRRRRSEMSKASTAGSTTGGSRCSSRSISSGSTVTSRSVRSESIVSSGGCCRSVGSICSSGSSICNIDSYSTTPIVDEMDINPVSPLFANMCGESAAAGSIESAPALKDPTYLDTISISTPTSNHSAVLPHSSPYQENNGSKYPYEPPLQHRYQQKNISSTAVTTTATTDPLMTNTSSEECQYPEGETSITTTSPTSYSSTHSSATPSQTSINPLKNPYYYTSYLPLNHSTCDIQSSERSMEVLGSEIWRCGMGDAGNEEISKNRHMDGSVNGGVDSIGDGGNLGGEEEEGVEKEKEDSGSSICSRSECADFGV